MKPRTLIYEFRLQAIEAKYFNKKVELDTELLHKAIKKAKKLDLIFDEALARLALGHTLQSKFYIVNLFNL